MKRKYSRRKINKIAAGGLGIVLLAAYLLTGNRGISAEEKAVYQDALEMQSQVEELGFKDFKLADYPVAMYDGKQDYVFYNGEVERREPILETFAGTAYPVEDHYEVIVPTLERFESLLSIAGGVEGMAKGSGYGKEEQIATIWHETLHAWQMSRFPALAERMNHEASGETDDEILVKEVDKKADVKKHMEIEMQFLQDIVSGDAMKAGNIDEIKKSVLKYKQLTGERKKQMSQKAIESEQRCEQMEGTAYYVEANVVGMEKGSSEYQKRYVDTLYKFQGGRAKYYRTGMAKCLILDQLMPGWKSELDFTKTMDELLYEAVS